MRDLSKTLDSHAPRHPLAAGVWRLCDPKISLASISSMILGAGIAAGHAPLDLVALGLTVIGILLVEAAKNGSGEIIDFDSGTDLMIDPADRSPFSGPAGRPCSPVSRSTFWPSAWGCGSRSSSSPRC